MDPKFVIIGPLEIFFGGDRRYRPDLVSNLARITRSLLLPPYYLAPQLGIEPSLFFINSEAPTPC